MAGWTRENHWARSVGEFQFRNYIEAVDEFAQHTKENGKPASLYVPAVIPYWGLVLESGGGRMHWPEAGIMDALPNTPRDGSMIASSKIGSFSIIPAAAKGPSTEIHHEWWGRLSYTGVEAGRFWFVDEAGAQLFTSELLYPFAWRIESSGFTLISPLLLGQFSATSPY